MVLRPPRFGKSLLLSAVKHYYDINSKDQFATLFGGLAAAKGEDERRNKYHVLHLDLSLAVRASSDLDAMEVLLNKKVNQAIAETAAHYGLTVAIDAVESTVSLLNFAAVIKDVPNVDHRRLLVVIDEYDRYANKLMFEHPAAYAKLVRGTSGQPLSSPVRSLFETLKSIEGLVDYRTFTTGITPLALADASGANNIKNLTFASTFADTFGLTDDNIVQALNDIGQTDRGAQQHILVIMRSYYNGYTFARSTRLVYNTTLCLFFLDKYNADAEFRQAVHLMAPDAALPDIRLIDENVKLSSNVVEVAKLVRFMPALCDELLENVSIPVASTQLSGSIRSSDLVAQPDFVAEDDLAAAQAESRLNVLSFMYYHGMVTFAVPPTVPSVTSSSSSAAAAAAAIAVPSSSLHLKIPNRLVRQNLYAALRGCLRSQYGVVHSMLRSPTVESVRSYLESTLDTIRTPTNRSSDESGAQRVLEMHLRLVMLNSGNFHLWIADGAGVQQGVSRPDLVILPADNKSLVHIELKVLRPHGLDARCKQSDSAIEALKKAISTETTEQLRERNYTEQFGSFRSYKVWVLENETRLKSERIYLPLLRREFPGRVIYSFTAIIMGDSVLVSQVCP